MFEIEDVNVGVPSRAYRAYTDEDIIKAASEVFSVRGMVQKLGLVPAGGNYMTAKKHLQRLNIDTSHWTGQGWSKEKQLKDYSKYRRVDLVKKQIIRERGHKCESCGITEWLGQKLTLEVDHINGDNMHHDPKNLKLLCPNCHSLTPTWRNRKR